MGVSLAIFRLPWEFLSVYLQWLPTAIVIKSESLTRFCSPQGAWSFPTSHCRGPILWGSLCPSHTLPPFTPQTCHPRAFMHILLPSCISLSFLHPVSIFSSLSAQVKCHVSGEALLISLTGPIPLLTFSQVTMNSLFIALLTIAILQMFLQLVDQCLSLPLVCKHQGSQNSWLCPP